jgi:hypothetical protein
LFLNITEPLLVASTSAVHCAKLVSLRGGCCGQLLKFGLALARKSVELPLQLAKAYPVQSLKMRLQLGDAAVKRLDLLPFAGSVKVKGLIGHLEFPIGRGNFSRKTRKKTRV